MFSRLFAIFSSLFTINLYNIIIFFQAVYNIRGSGNEVNSVLMRTAMTSQVHNTQQTPFQINLPFNQTKTARDPCVTRNTITITNTSFQLQILNYKNKYFFSSDVRRASTQTLPHFQVPSHYCWGGDNAPGLSWHISAYVWWYDVIYISYLVKSYITISHIYSRVSHFSLFF